jgi:hypothetical protein
MNLPLNLGPALVFVFYGFAAVAFNATFIYAILTGEVDVSPEVARDPRAFWIYVVSIGLLTIAIDLWLLRLWLRARARQKNA